MPNDAMLSLAEEIARIYRDVLQEPLPAELTRIMARLRQAES